MTCNYRTIELVTVAKLDNPIHYIIPAKAFTVELKKWRIAGEANNQAYRLTGIINAAGIMSEKKPTSITATAAYEEVMLLCNPPQTETMNLKSSPEILQWIQKKHAH